MKINIYLSNPYFGAGDQRFGTSNSNIERIPEEGKSEEVKSEEVKSEEVKSEKGRQASISSDFKEVKNETEAPQQAKPTVPKQIHPNTAHSNSKLVPTSKIFLPSNKNKLGPRQGETFTQNIQSVSKLKAKTDRIDP